MVPPKVVLMPRTSLPASSFGKWCTLSAHLECADNHVDILSAGLGKREECLSVPRIHIRRIRIRHQLLSQIPSR